MTQYYSKTKQAGEVQLPGIKLGADNSLQLEKSYKSRAVKGLQGIGPIGTPDASEMELLRRFLPDPTMTPEELFVWPVMMANDLPDRHIQRFDRETLQGFVDLPDALNPLGKSLIVAHGYEFGTGGVPEGRIYHAQVVSDPSNINPVTKEPTNWLVGRVYMTRTQDMEDTIQKIRSGVYAYVSVGVTVHQELDPHTRQAWGWDYYLSEDGTRRNEETGVSILHGAKEFFELSYKITLGAQLGAAVAGSRKSIQEDPMTLKALQTSRGEVQIAEEQFDATKAIVDGFEADLTRKQTELADLTGELTTVKADLDTAKTDLARVQSELASVKSQLSGAQTTITTLTAERDTAQSEIKGVRDALLEKLFESAVASGEDEEGATDLKDLYGNQSLQKISKRIQKFEEIKAKRFDGGRKSQPAETDQETTQPVAADIELGKSIASTLFPGAVERKE